MRISDWSSDVCSSYLDQPFEPALAAADCERVEQGLGRVLVPAVACVQHWAVDLVRDQRHRAGTGVADDDHVGGHGVQRHGGVDQRLALLHAGGGGGHVDDVRAQPLARNLEGEAGDRKTTRLNSSHSYASRMPSSAWTHTHQREEWMESTRTLIIVSM